MSVREFDPLSANLASRSPQTRTSAAGRKPPRSPFGGAQLVASSDEEPPRHSRWHRLYEVLFKGPPRQLSETERIAHLEVVRRGTAIAKEFRQTDPPLAEYAERCANASRNALADSRSENWIG